MSDFKFQKVFSIHFPGRKVYGECTFKKLHEKMEKKNMQIQKFDLRVIDIYLVKRK